jgi:hypothetical protein
MGNEPDLTRINRARVRQAKPELLPLRPFQLDITRRVRADRRVGVSVSEAEIRAALVCGYFKVRKTGVFW